MLHSRRGYLKAPGAWHFWHCARITDQKESCKSSKSRPLLRRSLAWLWGSNMVSCQILILASQNRFDIKEKLTSLPSTKEAKLRSGQRVDFNAAKADLLG